jgi:molybdenum cofactor biosynthesis protein MoaC
LKLYVFDGVDPALELMPLAARRALDYVGKKLSLEGWKSLSPDVRGLIVDAGSGPKVNIELVRAAIRKAVPEPVNCDQIKDPVPTVVPAEIAATLGPERPLSIAVWSALTPLDRYALMKVAESGNQERLNGAYREIVGHSAISTHVGAAGGVRMVSVSEKDLSRRSARASTRVTMNPDAFARLSRAETPKGDVLATARIAGIMAAKRTSELVPLCHPISLTRVDVELELHAGSRSVFITATVEAHDRTGVEMEALVAGSAAALTVYDMLKSFDRAMEIGPTRVEEKSGGRSGDYRR